MLQYHLFFQCVASFSSVLLQFYLAWIQNCFDFSFFLLIITVPTVQINWSTPMNTATVFRPGICFARWIFSTVQGMLSYLHPSLTSSGELPVSVITFFPWCLGTIDTSTFSLSFHASNPLQDFPHFIDFVVSHNSWISGFGEKEAGCWKLTLDLGLTSNVFICRSFVTITFNGRYVSSS